MKKILLSILLLLGMTLPSWAVVSSTINSNEYACNSSNTAWNYTFPIILSTDIYVYTVDQYGNITPQTSNFSVNTYTQTVTYPVSGTPCATGNSVLLVRIEPFTQQVAASNQGPAPSPVVMTMSDKLTMLAQQLNNNGVQSAPGGGTVTMPPFISGDLLGWGATPGTMINVSNPSLVAQWTLSGVNISYNTGNVSTTNNMTANTFNGALNGNINWPAVSNLLKSANVNWQDFNLTPTINSSGVNWNDINRVAKINAGGINWPSLSNNIQSSGINWPSVPANTINTSGLNWTSLYTYGSSTSAFSYLSGPLKIVYGVAPSVTTSQSITNLPFTSSTSYSCSAVMQDPIQGGAGVNVVHNSASQITLYPYENGQNLDWICIGT